MLFLKFSVVLEILPEYLCGVKVFESQSQSTVTIFNNAHMLQQLQ